MPNPAQKLDAERGAAQSASVPSQQDETLAVSPSGPGVQPGFGLASEHGEVGWLGPYRIVKELGHGGMGAVYAAIDTRLHRKLALKVMLPQFARNASAKERFLREARAAANISHDNVVTVYEADERDGVPYIAMQFLQGYPLDQYLKKKGNPSIAQISVSRGKPRPAWPQPTRLASFTATSSPPISGSKLPTPG
jgi:serine/threonine protein kinase